jgi:hypothetical protein
VVFQKNATFAFYIVKCPPEFAEPEGPDKRRLDKSPSFFAEK